MALPRSLIQPSGYITTTNKNGVEVVTDFKLTEVSFSINPPIYKMEEICPLCGGNQFRFLSSGKTCIKCNEKMPHVVALDEPVELKMRAEYVCSKCGIRYDPDIVQLSPILIKNGIPTCPQCNYEMTYVMNAGQEIETKIKNDDIIKSRFDILDL